MYVDTVPTSIVKTYEALAAWQSVPGLRVRPSQQGSDPQRPFRKFLSLREWTVANTTFEPSPAHASAAASWVKLVGLSL